MLESIHTAQAPGVIGCYSQAVRAGNVVYISGQIGCDPKTMVLSEDFTTQAHQVFENLKAICQESGGSLAQCVKLTVYLIDLEKFEQLNEVMQAWFQSPFSARATVEVSAFPKGASVEIDAMMVRE